MDKKIWIGLALLIIVFSIGCIQKVDELPSQEETIDQELTGDESIDAITANIAGIDSIEQELDFSELDNIEQELASLEW